jgi:hypothetical protein
MFLVSLFATVGDFPKKGKAMLVVLIVISAVAVLVTAISFFTSLRHRRLQVLKFDRWLRLREAHTPKRFWIELIAVAIASALLIVLFDMWLASKLHPATLESVLTWGTRIA